MMFGEEEWQRCPCDGNNPAVFAFPKPAAPTLSATANATAIATVKRQPANKTAQKIKMGGEEKQDGDPAFFLFGNHIFTKKFYCKRKFLD